MEIKNVVVLDMQSAAHREFIYLDILFHTL